MHTTPLRVTICPIEYHNNYGELTRFEVDAATTTLQEVAERVSADPLLHCKTARIGLTLSPYEGDVTGDPIDLSDPAIALAPLSAVAAHLLPRSAERACGGPVAFVDLQELWLVVGGCATEAAALEFIGGALLKAQLDAANLRQNNILLKAEVMSTQQQVALLSEEAAAAKKEVAQMTHRNTALAEEVTTMKKEAAFLAAELQSLRASVEPQLLQNRSEAFKEATALVATCQGNTNKALRRACERGQTLVSVCLVRELGADVALKAAAATAAGSGEGGGDTAAAGGLFWDYNHTSLHFAAMNGRTETVRALVKEAGADVTARNKNGWTPLHTAAVTGHTDTVRALVIELGADVNAKADDGGTPLHLAVEGHCPDTARVLAKELGADVGARNKRGKTPLECATSSCRAAFEAAFC